MGMGNTFIADVLKLIFNATNISLLADNTATTPLTVIYLALHTADPTASGDQTSSEATYTSYARISLARTSGGWTQTGQLIENAALAQFPQCTGGSNTITYVSIGTATSGAGKILFSGALAASLAVSNLIQPQFATHALTLTLA